MKCVESFVEVASKAKQSSPRFQSGKGVSGRYIGGSGKRTQS
ncbi:hypothetical protein EGR_05819 [Echinococcus granulosus]|uniref:Uncharacterized protein n=1 Tax=Echinococcus granulosus TaxID=6210 RepID=W6UDD9_ECHGR|nr:hypothetical protein EGR_05819 [Echinococcus granulosus]EUB59335.1 hypothetical protein EGR_05819 [Echinococcus granulosus]